MAKKRSFGDNLITGLKAIGGAMVHYIIMAVLLLLFAFFAGGIANIGPFAMFLLALLMLVTGIFVLGWIYNKFWGWK